MLPEIELILLGSDCHGELSVDREASARRFAVGLMSRELLEELKTLDQRP